VPEVISEHELRMVEQVFLLDDINQDDKTKSMVRAKILELEDQLKTFNEIVLTLAPRGSLPVEENKRILNILKREIKRLKAHLPIYARRSELIDKISSHRVVILQADTGSGKSTQVVQYLVDAGFADRGLFI
jgi:ATP-dependent RNA helicase DHX8/PRP22